MCFAHPSSWRRVVRHCHGQLRRCQVPVADEAMISRRPKTTLAVHTSLQRIVEAVAETSTELHKWAEREAEYRAAQAALKAALQKESDAHAETLYSLETLRKGGSDLEVQQSTLPATLDDWKLLGKRQAEAKSERSRRLLAAAHAAAARKQENLRKLEAAQHASQSASSQAVLLAPSAGDALHESVVADLQNEQAAHAETQRKLAAMQKENSELQQQLDASRDVLAKEKADLQQQLDAAQEAVAKESPDLQRQAKAVQEARTESAELQRQLDAAQEALAEAEATSSPPEEAQGQGDFGLVLIGIGIGYFVAHRSLSG
eukprot:gnl/TRDRNA2_/TRDRNA2_85700_c0_seq3.p1 gnl/TRDRNA2_/TRDRNA2_85700_c0~~gnl/TRDRNA2_/TRDRNA2_85700_c0_seq3.p1  ORF type:complete len:317 (+),score=77.20 gnl/TRDRNA2_/TRDRNA2_85700_c0_seq3:53-1003(+)